MIGHLDLMAGGVVHRAGITMLGGWSEELGAGHGLVEGGGQDLGLLRQDGVDGNTGGSGARLQLWGTDLSADEVGAAG